MLGCACTRILDHALFRKTTPTNGQRVGLHSDKLLELNFSGCFIPILYSNVCQVCNNLKPWVHKQEIQ